MRALILGTGIGSMYADVLSEIVEEVILLDTIEDKSLDTVCGVFDLVVIAVPNFLHEHFATIVANKGLARLIVVDKPGFANKLAWTSFINNHPDIRLQMVKNNMFRDSIEKWKQAYYSNVESIIEVRWLNDNRVPKPGSWFTNKELSYGGVEVDLLPHLLNVIYAIRGNLPEVSYVDFSQSWSLSDLIDSDYGDVFEDGVYDVYDFAEINFNDGSMASADWRTKCGKDDISLRICVGSTTIFEEELGLCPCDAYSEMFRSMLNMSVDQHNEWSELDILIQSIIHIGE